MRDKPQTRIVRQRKLNKSTLQPVLRENEIEDFDSLQNQYHVETGVERSEENVSHVLSTFYSACHVHVINH